MKWLTWHDPQIKFEKYLSPKDFSELLKQKNIVLGGISFGFRTKTADPAKLDDDDRGGGGSNTESETFFEFVDFVEVSRVLDQASFGTMLVGI